MKNTTLRFVGKCWFLSSLQTIVQVKGNKRKSFFCLPSLEEHLYGPETMFYEVLHANRGKQALENTWSHLFDIFLSCF